MDTTTKMILARPDSPIVLHYTIISTTPFDHLHLTPEILDDLIKNCHESVALTNITTGEVDNHHFIDIAIHFKARSSRTATEPKTTIALQYLFKLTDDPITIRPLPPYSALRIEHRIAYYLDLTPSDSISTPSKHRPEFEIYGRGTDYAFQDS